MTVDGPSRGGRLLTRGHDRAVAAVRMMIAGRTPHAILISGPPGIGKTTLALDLAAGLLCHDPDPAARPCRTCRGCRLVERGRHPDLHRLRPSGPGDQIRIGNRERPDEGTVRRLASDLVLLPVEGGARVAIVERADRLGDDAQTALLKTLEEPPAGVAIVLCADDEDRLMATVRSRCARIRLGPVATREIEVILLEFAVADAPLAARLARVSAGRPGVAWSLARAPEAMAARDEIARTLLDLLAGRPSTRLAAGRDLVARATDLARATERSLAAEPDSDGGPGGSTRRGRGRAGTRGPSATPEAIGAADGRDRPIADATADESDGDPEATADAADPIDSGAGRATAPASERRRTIAILVGLWRELTRDLLVVRLGAEREVRDPAILDDLRAAAAALGPHGGDAAGGADDGADAGPAVADVAAAQLTAFLHRLDVGGELLDANVRPELVLDTLLLAWPSPPAR